MPLFTKFAYTVMIYSALLWRYFRSCSFLVCCRGVFVIPSIVCFLLVSW